MKGTARAAMAAPALVLLALVPGSAVAAGGEAEQAGGRYQIVRASESRVWRLDTATGEISVCTLRGERLVCSTSSKAVTPPETSYQELQAERAAREEAEAERQIALIDRFMAMIREFMAYAIRNEHGQEPGGHEPGGQGQQ